jgi:hypothetical protein
MKRKSRMIDDCLVLLDYVAKHPNEKQSYNSLAKNTHISRRMLKTIIHEARHRYDSILARTATKYSFDFEVFDGPTLRYRKKLIGAVYIGYWT